MKTSRSLPVLPTCGDCNWNDLVSVPPKPACTHPKVYEFTPIGFRPVDPKRDPPEWCPFRQVPDHKAQVAAMKLRALAAHETIWKFMNRSPEEAFAALGDHGEIHESIHAIIRVETEDVTVPKEWEDHLARQDRRIERLEAELAAYRKTP